MADRRRQILEAPAAKQKRASDSVKATMRYQEFERRVSAAGLEPRDCGWGHWQIRGGAFLVNFWADTKQGARYQVAGMSGTGGTLAKAIAAASSPVPVYTGQSPETKRRGKRNYYRAVKRRLHRIDPRCHVCKGALTLAEATIDHLIPLSKGGSNGQDNLRIAHDGCNGDKADTMPVQARVNA